MRNRSNLSPLAASRLRRRAITLQSHLAGLIAVLSNLVLELVVKLLFPGRTVKIPRRILVLRSGMIGDFVCCLPALSVLRKRYPQSTIALLTMPTGNPRYWGKGFTVGASLLTDVENSVIDRVIAIRGEELKSISLLRSLREEIKAYAPDLAVPLPQTGERLFNMLRKMLFLRLLGVRSSLLGYRLDKPFTVFRNAQFAHGGFKHQVVTAWEAVAGSKQDKIEFPIRIPQTTRDKVAAVWQKLGLEATDFVVGLFPGGKYEHKRWPVEKFAVLCEQFATESSVSFVVFGELQERPLAEFLQALCRAPLVNLVGQTSLLETAEFLRRCDLYIGNDSGPAHLAAAMGTPCVTLFSSILFPRIWDPWGNRNITIRHAVSCQYCFSEHRCPRGTMECIRGISVQEVVDATKPYLQKKVEIPPAVMV
jgi:heptosyltransferase-2